jgi:hypothetical protein
MIPPSFFKKSSHHKLSPMIPQQITVFSLLKSPKFSLLVFFFIPYQKDTSPHLKPFIYTTYIYTQPFTCFFLYYGLSGGMLGVVVG